MEPTPSGSYAQIENMWLLSSEFLTVQHPQQSVTVRDVPNLMEGVKHCLYRHSVFKIHLKAFVTFLNVCGSSHVPVYTLQWSSSYVPLLWLSQLFISYICKEESMVLNRPITVLTWHLVALQGAAGQIPPALTALQCCRFATAAEIPSNRAVHLSLVVKWWEIFLNSHY